MFWRHGWLASHPYRFSETLKLLTLLHGGEWGLFYIKFAAANPYSPPWRGGPQAGVVSQSDMTVRFTY